ncbi:MAG: NUDIX domain-containing protein [Mariprofundaceae bacterium]|nr:NUDIX domain-containing protein [Mariprofundaceae bacterium]
MQTSVVIGRFQVPDLHEGHRHLLDVANQADQLIIVVGVHVFPASRDHPMDFDSRRMMLEKYYPQATILGLNDTASDRVWSAHLDALIQAHTIFESVILYAGRDSFSSHYYGQFSVHHVAQIEQHNGQGLRQKVRDKPLDSHDFRHGVVYATQAKYSTFYMTVDIALLCQYEGRTWVLLGYKKHEPKRWCFPGGFVDAGDETTELAARRELYAETAYQSKDDLKLVGHFRIKDWRQTPDQQLITFFYTTWCDYTSFKAANHLEQLAWHSLEHLDQINFADDHAMLYQQLIAYYIPIPLQDAGFRA